MIGETFVVRIENQTFRSSLCSMSVSQLRVNDSMLNAWKSVYSEA